MSSSYVKRINDYVRLVHQYALKELQSCKEYQADEKNLIKRSSPWGRLSKFQNRVTYMKELKEEKWASLNLTAKGEVKEHLGALEELEQKQSTVAKLYKDLPDLRLAFGKAIPPSSRSDWQQERQRLYLLAEKKGLEQEKIEIGLKYLDNYDPKKEWKLIEGIVIKMYERLHLDWTRREAVLMGSRLADLVASVNLQVINSPSDSLESLSADTLAILEKLNKIETEIWTSLKNKVDMQVLREKIRLLKEQVIEDIQSFTIPKLALVSDFRKEKLQDPSIGNLAISIADLARRQLRAQALADALSWAIKFEGKVLDEWIKAAQSATSFETKSQWPQIVSIDTLASAPQQYDGQAVAIEGVVQDVTIRHKGHERKVISTAVVAGENSKITVSLPFVKLDSGGFVPGSWCHIAGVWKSSSKDAAGEPALEIDRIPYSKLGKESFDDWLTNHIAPLFSPISHEIAGSWSWELGSEGAANPLKYGVWCRHEGGSKHGRR